MNDQLTGENVPAGWMTDTDGRMDESDGMSDKNCGDKAELVEAPWKPKAKASLVFCSKYVPEVGPPRTNTTFTDRMGALIAATQGIQASGPDYFRGEPSR